MLNSYLRRHARTTPRAVAIQTPGERITYAEFLVQVERAAAGLLGLGLEPGGGMVATCMSNGIDHLVALYAIARIGATVATLDPSLTLREIAQICDECRPTVLLIEAPYALKCAEALTAAGYPFVIVSDAIAGTMRRVLDLHAADRRLPDDVWTGDYLLQYTSGSTGKPKGVLIGQSGLCARMRSWTSTAGLTAADSHLCILPLTHGFGNYCVSLPALTTGGTLHMMPPSHANPIRVLRYLTTERISCFYALPFFYQLLAEAGTEATWDLSRVRIAMVGAAPVTAATLDAAHDTLGLRLNNTYGSSETGSIITDLEPPSPSDGSIGRLMNDVEARLLPHPLASAPDSGELVARTPGLATRYFSPKDGAILRDGWLHTGDLVRREQGRYFIIGRVSQFINVAGNKVSPIEVEEVIQGIAGVREVAVFGSPDPLTSQAVTAVVVASSAVTPEIIRLACRAKLADYKVPRHVQLANELPKSPAGKVRRSGLLGRT